MIKAKRYLLKAREYLSNFKKVEKKSGPPKLKVTTKKTVNLAVIGGISFLLFVGLMGSVRAITLSNKVGTLQAQVEATKKQKAQPVDANRKYDYKVKYKEMIQHDKDTEEKELVTGFNIPFDEKEGKYYVSGLPWFSAIESSQAGHFSEDDQLQLTANDHVSDSQHKKVEKFLKVFFTNYTTNQDNLNLIAKNVAIVANTTFKTIDYTYLKKDGAGLIAYVQATFEVGGTTHSENFTFTLSEKDKSYYVTKLEHTIPLNYANDKD